MIMKLLKLPCGVGIILVDSQHDQHDQDDNLAGHAASQNVQFFFPASAATAKSAGAAHLPAYRGNRWPIQAWGS